MGRRAAAVGLLVVAVALAFAPVRECAFLNLDDDLYVTRNPQALAGLTWDGVVESFTSTVGSMYLPLARISHAADVEFFGTNPAGHHLVNVVVHAMSALLLLLVLDRMTGAFWRSLIVAALFALHPLRVESVAWVAERKDVLAALFGMLTLLAYHRYTEQVSRRRYLVVAACLVLSLLSKPMLVTMPVLLLLLDVWPLARRDRSPAGLIVEKVPLASICAVVAIATIAVVGGHGSMAQLGSHSWAQRLANAIVSYGRYLGKTLWPHPLAVYYPLPAALEPAAVAAAATLLAALLVGAVLACRRAPYLLIGYLWFAVCLLPVSGVLQAGEQAMADRFTYFPSIGLLLAMVWGTHALVHAIRLPRALAAAAAVSVLLALGVATRRQVYYWRDSTTLLTHAVQVTENNWFVLNNLGDALLAEGRYDEAAARFEEAVRIRPDFVQPVFGLGVAAAGRGDLERAEAQYRRAIELVPVHVGAHNNLGVLLRERGEAKEAIAHLSWAVQLNPTSRSVAANLERSLADAGLGAAEIEDYLRSVRAGTVGTTS